MHFTLYHPQYIIMFQILFVGFGRLTPFNPLENVGDLKHRIVIWASGKTRVSTRTWRARVMGKRRADLRDQFLMGKDARALAARHLYCPEKKIVRIWRARDMGKWRADLREEFFVGKDARFKIFKIFQNFQNFQKFSQIFKNFQKNLKFSKFSILFKNFQNFQHFQHFQNFVLCLFVYAFLSLKSLFVSQPLTKGSYRAARQGQLNI